MSETKHQNNKQMFVPSSIHIQSNQQHATFSLTFSLLISTVAVEPTAVAILLARVLKADHCLQASIVTTLLEVEEDAAGFFVGTAAFFTAALDLEAEAFFTGVFFLAGAGFLAGASSFLPAATRVDLRVPVMMKCCWRILIPKIALLVFFCLISVFSNNFGKTC